MSLNKLHSALSEFVGCVLVYGAIYLALWGFGLAQHHLRDALLVAWGMTSAQVLSAWRNAR